MKIDVLDLSGNKVEELDLNNAVFNCKVNNQAIFDAILRQQSSLRQGTHDTKGRSEVSGGGKKPFKQKGTGRAREGSTRATQFRHGGVPFGPTPRSHTFKLNRKVRRLALRSGLTLKAKEKDLIVVNDLKVENVKTKEFAKVLENLKIDRKAYFVVDVLEDYEKAYLSMRNIPGMVISTVEGLNIFDIQNANKLVLTKSASEKIGEVLKDE